MILGDNFGLHATVVMDLPCRVGFISRQKLECAAGDEPEATDRPECNGKRGRTLDGERCGRAALVWSGCRALGLLARSLFTSRPLRLGTHPCDHGHTLVDSLHETVLDTLHLGAPAFLDLRRLHVEDFDIDQVVVTDTANGAHRKEVGAERAADLRHARYFRATE